MERLGYTTTIVEHWNGHCGRKQDFDGYIDAISLNPNKEPHTLGIQCTSISNMSSRWHKITDGYLMDNKKKTIEPNPRPAKAKRWLQCRNGIWIIGFKTASLRDKEVKIRRVTLDSGGKFVYEDERQGGGGRKVFEIT